MQSTSCSIPSAVRIPLGDNVAIGHVISLQLSFSSAA
ncbi:Uncharacterised protein [Mycobacteroides abscessus subsp. abscessus]|nr:Uncharacterised protein [Mycobacteroides abscessus subsp. abscessus]